MKKNKIKEHKKHSLVDSGRSMIEMIMVIAVVGALSVAAFTGGKSLLLDNVANNTVQEIASHAVNGAELLAKGQPDLSLTTDNITSNGYKANMALTDNDNAPEELKDTYYVTLSKVPPEICTRLKTSKLPNVVKVVTTPDNCASEDNKVDYYFNGDEMEDNFYGNGNSNGGSSGGDDDWKNKIEETPDVCPVKLPYQGTDGKCYNCDSEGDLPLLKNDCFRCIKREMWDGICVLSECGKYSQAHLPLKGTDDVCYKCDDAGALPLEKSYCDECPEREMWEDECVVSECGKYSQAHLPYEDEEGICRACLADEHCGDNGYCYNNECIVCPAGSFFDRTIGKCYVHPICPIGMGTFDEQMQSCVTKTEKEDIFSCIQGYKLNRTCIGYSCCSVNISCPKGQGGDVIGIILRDCCPTSGTRYYTLTADDVMPKKGLSSNRYIIESRREIRWYIDCSQYQCQFKIQQFTDCSGRFSRPITASPSNLNDLMRFGCPKGTIEENGKCYTKQYVTATCPLDTIRKNNRCYLDE